MKYSIFYSAITAATAIFFAACSPQTDVAGIGGSGITSTGTITGFGSIFVNDIEFFTDSSTFDVDDNPDLTEDDLAIGMRVTVKGTLNADGVTGTATSVTYDDTLQGPVSNDPVVDPVDPSIKTVSVLGIEVTLNSMTHFDTSDSLPELTFENISKDNNIEISGSFDSNGVLVATRVELKDQLFQKDDSEVELRGTIANWNAGTSKFNVEGFPGIIIDASKTPEIEDISAIANGAFVEVKGTCPDPACSTIEATRIQGESKGFDDNDGGEVEIDGFITRYVDDSDFDVDGLPVDASDAKIESSLPLALDLRVEVKGIVVNNVLIASKVELED